MILDLGTRKVDINEKSRETLISSFFDYTSVRRDEPYKIIEVQVGLFGKNSTQIFYSGFVLALYLERCLELSGIPRKKQ